MYIHHYKKHYWKHTDCLQDIENRFHHLNASKQFVMYIFFITELSPRLTSNTYKSTKTWRNPFMLPEIRYSTIAPTCSTK